jgi:hypothetical protein
VKTNQSRGRTNLSFPAQQAWADRHSATNEIVRYKYKVVYLRSFSLICVLFPLLFIGCNSSSTPDNESSSSNNVLLQRLATIRLATITPDPITLNETVKVLIETDGSQASTAGIQYQWMVNGAPLLDQIGPTLTPTMLKRGDRVSVDLVPTSGTVQGIHYQAGPAMVGNTSPVVTRVSIERPVDSHDQVFAKVEAVDADLDEMQFDFRWWRNDKVVKQGPEQTLDTTGFQTKDTLEVEVTPRDQLSAGKPVRSESVYFGNSPPKIISVPAALIVRERYEYTVKAVDADGDPLSFLLEAGPPGMVIDKETGHLVWQIPQDQLGRHRVRIIAEDGQGGTAFQEFDFTLPASGKPSKPGGV